PDVYVPAGFGWTVHVDPFRCSIRATSFTSVVFPTAMHAVVPEQETPCRSAGSGIVTFGGRWSDHLDRTHCSANAAWSPSWSVTCPTATHRPAKGHETAARLVTSSLPARPVTDPRRGIRSFCLDHPAPFQCSANGVVSCPPLAKLPNAVQLAAVAQETAVSEAPRGPAK